MKHRETRNRMDFMYMAQMGSGLHETDLFFKLILQR